jgi:D-sedoheptulose 7-phosphate isomerase
MDAYENDRTIFVIGNGGSAANATHFAQDLAKGVIPDQHITKRIRALSLTDNVSYITAVANDDGYQNIFSSQLRTFGSPGDLLIAISGSGNSANIIEAVMTAKALGIKCFGITGYDGGKLLPLSDSFIHVKLNDMCTVESIHSILFHYIIEKLKKDFIK